MAAGIPQAHVSISTLLLHEQEVGASGSAQREAERRECEESQRGDEGLQDGTASHDGPDHGTCE